MEEKALAAGEVLAILMGKVEVQLGSSSCSPGLVEFGGMVVLLRCQAAGFNEAALISG